MFNERGGSNTMARHAFNELVSFVAGWAILIDYVIVIALAAVTVPHYLAPISGELADGTWEVVIAMGVVALVAVVNTIGYTGNRRQGWLVALTASDLALQFLLIVVGIAVLWDPSSLTSQLDLFTSPSLSDLAYALVVSMVALAGIEAASDLAPDLAWRREDLRHVLRAGSIVVPLVYVGMAVVALMAMPVVATPDGPQTVLSTVYEDAPVLGIAAALEPQWLSEIAKWAVVAIAPLILMFAANATMLGLSRHVYVLATNRQIPSWLGKLGKRRSTPFVAIGLSAAAAMALVIPGDVELLAGVFAFGAMLAISIAHASLIRLRFSEPEAERPYRVPLGIGVRGASLPLPSLLGLALTGIGLVSIVALHGGAFWVGGGWMLFGLVAYFVYRRLIGESRSPPGSRCPSRHCRSRYPTSSSRASSSRSSARASTTRSSRPRVAWPTRTRSPDRASLGSSSLRDQAPADGAPQLAAAARADRQGRQGDRASARDRRGVPVGRGARKLDAGPRRRGGDRGAGARARGRGDHRRRRASDEDPRRCGARRRARVEAGGDRPDHRVRAAPRALQGAADGAA